MRLIQYLLNRIIRNLFWFYRLNSTSIGSQTKIAFPIIIEGKGKLTIGNNSVVGCRANLGSGIGTELTFGDNVTLDDNVYVRIGGNAKVSFGDKIKLGRHCEIYTNADWVIEDNVKIESYCALFAREPGKNGKLTIGKGSHIGDYTIIDLVDDVTIGKEVALGPRCTLYTHDHSYSDKEKAAWKGPLIKKNIVIRDGVWVGSNVTILPGVEIGEHAVIAAGSVVTQNVEPHTVYGGVPAKKIKQITYE